MLKAKDSMKKCSILLHEPEEAALSLSSVAPRHCASCIYIFVLCIFVCCGNKNEKALRASAQKDIQNISSASSFEEVFSIVSRIRLDTLPECPISSITDFNIDEAGNFIIADGWDIRQVYCFAQDGRFIRTIGGRGQGPGEYATPISIAIHPHVGIVICDYQQNQLLIYNNIYQYQKSIRGNPRFQYFVHLNSLGEIYTYSGTVGPNNINVFNTIHKYNDSGKETDSFGPVQPKVLKLGFSAVVDGMTISNNGFIFEKNPLYYQIRKFDPSGALIRSFSRPDSINKVENFAEGKISNGPFSLQNGLIIIQRGNALDIFNDEGAFLRGDLPIRDKVLFVKDNTLFLEEHEDDKGAHAGQANPTIIRAVLRDKSWPASNKYIP